MTREDPVEITTNDAEEQLAVAERELLEARATFTVRRKATESILMTDPILKAVHSAAASPAERYATVAHAQKTRKYGKSTADMILCQGLASAGQPQRYSLPRLRKPVQGANCYGGSSVECRG